MTPLLNNIHVIILAGGSGTRFWPLSRETCPKQMLQIVGEDTLIRQTIKRINGFVPQENIWIVTTEDKAQDIKFHLLPMGSSAEKIQFIREPLGRNTAPAIGLAAVYLNHLSPDSIMVVMPSDHAIPENEKFLGDLKVAIGGAKEGNLVTFGIKPNHPETGYGYIKVDKNTKAGVNGFLKVERFVEKPNIEKAKTYLSDGNYFWNSGIFVWKTSKILSEIQTYLPDLYKTLEKMTTMLFPEPGKQTIPQSLPVRQAGEIPARPAGGRNPCLAGRQAQLSKLYASLESISIDYGIMERSADVLMVPGTFQWSDLGSWTALDEILEKDEQGNILKGNTIDIESQNSIVYSDKRLIATIGLKDMVVVDTPDATLVAPKERVQEVRKIVETLKNNGREEHLLHKTVARPWGSYTVLEKGEGYKIKRVVLNPGAKLSLQLHRKRSEHWVVVSGTAKVTRDTEVYLVHTNESTYIPTHSKHRLENPGEVPLQIIEVQNGDYVEEDDIERFDDIYGRS